MNRRKLQNKAGFKAGRGVQIAIKLSAAESLTLRVSKMVPVTDYEIFE